MEYVFNKTIITLDDYYNECENIKTEITKHLLLTHIPIYRANEMIDSLIYRLNIQAAESTYSYDLQLKLYNTNDMLICSKLLHNTHVDDGLRKRIWQYINTMIKPANVFNIP